ncbi:LPS assembly lipoprotein LptE [Pararhizobium sp. IMCC21322]|uniref:LPS assembly lipoprotein LptE n=1 Tax=Pararhizobium sp. IMCC21322 TaxID=3067903 RepID=UPI002740EACA|nr:LPS assembly lipoprotein LptE [Pararhizobium sp. IMCC21322]
MSESRQMQWTLRILKTPALAVILLGLLTAACNVRPVYGPNGGYGIDKVSNELAAIGIDSAKGRVSQELRNRLIFTFNHGRSVAEKRYQMSYTLAESDDAIAIEERSGAPSSYRLTVIVQYRVMDPVANTLVTAGTVRASASYDRSSQSFANIRARRDAENRAANSAADEITARISTFFATRQ